MKLMKVRYPRHDIQSFREEIENLFEKTFEDFDLIKHPLKGNFEWKPAIELQDEDKNYILKAELPGIDKADIKVEIEENLVTISGESKFKHEEKDKGLYRSEFRYGKFMRSVALPSKINSEESKAEFKDGVLKITAPKIEVEHKKLKKLDIN